MKILQTKDSCFAMTLVEVLVVIAILLTFAALLLGALNRPYTKAPRIACVNNLKQTALGLRIWSNENGERFPWAVSETNATSSTLEIAESIQTWRHFSIVSNEINTPKVLACPSDTRKKAATWQEFTSNNNLSYFAGLDADETKPQTILSGDRNLESSAKTADGILRLSTNTPVEWTMEIHNRQGNIALSDGSAQQTTVISLRKQVQAALSTSTNGPVLRLAIPE